MSNDSLEGYERYEFTASLRNKKIWTRPVYAAGEGPPIVLIQELPGIGPATLELAERLRETDQGFRVVLPHLFGPLGRDSVAGNLGRVLCMRQVFSLFGRDESSPAMSWLSALCAEEARRAPEGLSRVGVIGMCMTGNFALGLIAEPSVFAAVASQPSNPVRPARALHLSPEELTASRARLDEVGPMLALRFSGDPLCPAGRFRAIDRAFNDDRQRVELHTVPGIAHSVITRDLVDREGHPTLDALRRVQSYFVEKLRADS